MSAVEVVRKRSLDIGRRKADKMMSVFKSSYRLLIFVPVVFTLVFIYTYQPFREHIGICSTSPLFPTLRPTPLDFPDTSLSLSPAPLDPPDTSLSLSPTPLDPPDTSLILSPTPLPLPSTPLTQHPQRNSSPPLTIHTNEGRLGNQMLTFATLLGLSNLNGREMTIMPENYYVLSKYFDINYPVLDDENFVESDPWLIKNWLKDEDRNISETSNIIKGTLFPTSFTFFHHCRQQVADVFKFDSIVTRYVNRILDDVKAQFPGVEVFVGVHVRRGDYVKTTNGGWLRAFNGREVDGEYFRKAVEYFTDKYTNIVFLAVSDDKLWCEQNIRQYGINMVPYTPSEEYDLAVLAACNHTIMTYGTYGFWGGYLAGGEVVYFTDFLKPGTKQVEEYYRVDKMYPEEWVGISSTPPGYWDTYVNPFYLD